MEVILEFLSHIISNLTNAVKGSISDLWVRVSKVLDNDRNHWANLLDIINVLSDLGKSHESCILVSPVSSV